MEDKKKIHLKSKDNQIIECDAKFYNFLKLILQNYGKLLIETLNSIL